MVWPDPEGIGPDIAPVPVHLIVASNLYQQHVAERILLGSLCTPSWKPPIRCGRLLVNLRQ